MEKQPLVFALIFSLLFLNFVLAGSDWLSYGNAFSGLYDEQYNGVGHWGSGYSYIDGSGISYSGGYAPQSLVMVVNGSGYLVSQTKSYIDVSDKDLVVKDEIGLSNISSSIDIMDWNADGVNKILVLSRVNSTTEAFNVLSFDGSSISVYSRTYFSSNSSDVWGGIRHSDEFAVFIWNKINPNGSFNTTLVKVSNSSVSKIFINNTFGSDMRSPLSIGDFNNDDVMDYMYYSLHKVFVFDETGALLFFQDEGSSDEVLNARMFLPSGLNTWRVALLFHHYATFDSVYLSVHRLDGSLVWGGYPIFSSPSSDDDSYGSMAIGDYDRDSLDDIYVQVGSLPYNNYANFIVFKGTNGDTLAVKTTRFGTGGGGYLAVADMNNNGHKDFVSYNGVYLFVYDIFSNTFLISNLSMNAKNCIPADLDFVGNLNIICSDTSGIRKFSGLGYSNDNAVIDSVSYDPSLLVSVGTTVNALIYASDSNGDSILYNRKCSNNDSWGSETSSSVQSCYYGSVGVYNMTVSVRDYFHSDVNVFSSSITVTSSGEICDNDGSCESSNGETASNCPHDCTSVPNYTQVEGGASIPTEIVDVQNTNQGLLPEIYYGILGFLSYVLVPMIALVFFLFFIGIIFAIGGIIKKFAGKVGSR